MDPLREIQDKNMIFKLDKIVCQKIQYKTKTVKKEIIYLILVQK